MMSEDAATEIAGIIGIGVLSLCLLGVLGCLVLARVFKEIHWEDFDDE